MRLRVFLGLVLMALTYLGLAEGSPSSAWAGRSEVPSALADTLIGGAACPSTRLTFCMGTKCPGVSPCFGPGTATSGTLSSQLYCGCSKSCGGGQYYTTRTPCATSIAGTITP